MGSWTSEIIQHVALLIAVLAFRHYKLSFWHNFELSEEQLVANQNTKYTCNLAPGQNLATNIPAEDALQITNTGNNEKFKTDLHSKDYFYATEDTAVSYKHNFAATTIGFREHLFFNFHQSNGNWQPKFQGVFVHHNLDILSVNSNKNDESLEPVKIEIPDSNPHGIDIFDLENGKEVRIFVVSHENYDAVEDKSSGFEEVIYFDYDYVKREVVSEFKGFSVHIFLIIYSPKKRQEKNEKKREFSYKKKTENDHYSQNLLTQYDFGTATGTTLTVLLVFSNIILCSNRSLSKS